MKHFNHKIFYSILILIGFGSCETDIDKVKLQDGTAPALTSSSTTDLVLTKAQQAYNSLQFQWTNPNYQFSNGVNTQSISYTFQIDTTGSNFSTPKQVALGFTNALTTSFKVKDLNKTLAGMELKDGIPHSFEFRVKATISGSNVPLYSNVVTIKITTYLDVVFPVPPKLFITGAATPLSWQAGNGTEAEPAGQKFTLINPYTFVLNSVQLNGASGYLLIPVYSSWGAKYGFTGDKEKNNPVEDTFKPDGTDFLSPASGKYKITVDFKTGKISLAKL